jgi:hypothetical protein
MAEREATAPGTDLNWLLDDFGARVEHFQAFLFITAAGQGSCLAVLCAAEADAGLIAYEMAVLAKRAGPHLASRPRFPADQTWVK